MAVPSISNVSSTAALSTSVSPAPKPSTVAIAAPPAPPQADTVKLSVTAQVHQLSSDGQSAKQIGSSLGLSTSAVSGYLGAQLPKVVVKVQSAPPPVVAPSAAPEAAPTTPVPASQLPPNS